MHKNKKAFTLIELLVVVLIIGILSAIALPQYRLAVYKTRLSALLLLMKSITQAQQIYFLENGKYTNNPAEWGIDLPAGTTVGNTEDSTTGFTLSNGDYLESVKESIETAANPRLLGHCKDCPAKLWVNYKTNEWKCYHYGDAMGKRLCKNFGADASCVDNCTNTVCGCSFSF